MATVKTITLTNIQNLINHFSNTEAQEAYINNLISLGAPEALVADARLTPARMLETLPRLAEFVRAFSGHDSCARICDEGIKAGFDYTLLNHVVSRRIRKL